MKKKTYSPRIFVSKTYSIEQCRTHFDSLFVFGDNDMRIGMGGQAIVREQVNTIGFSTKKAPGGAAVDYYTDDEYKENCERIEEEIKKIWKYAEEKDYKVIVFPYMGLGTGLSEMPIRCIKTFSYLCLRLAEEFSYNNLEGQFNKNT